MTLHPADALFIESLRAIGYVGDANAVLENLQFMHAVPPRYYHTWDYHIRGGITFLAKHRPVIVNFAEVVVAFGFHDCKCKAGAKDNEQASSMHDRHVLEAGQVPNVLLAHQDVLIMATTHARDLTYAPWPVQQIADLDLMLIGAPPKVFRENTAKLREEARHVDDATFSMGIRGFFQSLKNRPYIYYTPLFRNLYETQAQENLDSLLVP